MPATTLADTELASMDDDDCLVSIPEIQKALGGRSRAYVYANVLPKLELVKVGNTTNAVRRSLRQYIADLPRTIVKPKAA